jgi:hypothetical protein
MSEKESNQGTYACSAYLIKKACLPLVVLMLVVRKVDGPVTQSSSRYAIP